MQDSENCRQNVLEDVRDDVQICSGVRGRECVF